MGSTDAAGNTAGPLERPVSSSWATAQRPGAAPWTQGGKTRDSGSSLGSPASLRSLALNPIDGRIRGLSAVIGVTAALVLDAAGGGGGGLL